MRVSTLLTGPLAILALAKTVVALTVNSPPSLVKCQPIAITWSGAADGQIFISIIEGGNPSSAALESFPTQSGSSGSLTWTVDLDAGTSITIKVVDSTGNIAYSAPITIQAGQSPTCSGSVSGGGSGTNSATSQTSASSSAGGSSSASSSAGSQSSGSQSANSSSTGGTTTAGSLPTTTAGSRTPLTTATSTSPSSTASSTTTRGGSGAGFTNKAAMSAVFGLAGVAAFVVSFA